jgi:hypothetical protein
MKMKKWKNVAPHGTGCPYKGIAVHETDKELEKYHSGRCPGCNNPVKWEEEKPGKEDFSAAS